ncbi:MAG: hypothetical protein KC609_16080, partial [Myxococcales bacterium]|nr:hypothetical protein [Myxococcales bacterium]
MIGSQYSRCKLWLLAVSIFALGCVPNPGRLEGNGNADAAGDMTADSGSADVLADTAVGDGLSDAVIGDSSGTPDGDSVAPPDLDDGSAPDVPPSDDSDDATSVPPDYPEGILGGPPTGPFKVIATVEVRNDTSLIRQREIAFSGIPLAKIDDVRDVAKLILVDAQNRWVQAQFNVLSRWGGALGTISDNSRPIRWLEISLPTSLAANASGTFELREYTANAPLANDPLSAAIVKDGSLYRVTTGVARFTLNPYNPALIELIEVDFGQSGTFSTVYMHKAGAGPRMLTGGGAVVETLASYDTLAVDNTVSVDPSPDDVGSPDFEIVEEGPVKIVVRVRGHFRRPQERRDCTDNNFSDATDPFGFSAALTFYRGSADVGLLFNFRNECG